MPAVRETGTNRYYVTGTGIGNVGNEPALSDLVGPQWNARNVEIRASPFSRAGSGIG